MNNKILGRKFIGLGFYGKEFLGTTEEFDTEAYNVLNEGEYEEEEGG